MIVEGVVLAIVDVISAVFSMFSSLGLTPTWPTWLTGSSSGTVRGSFQWLSDGLQPFAAWINMPLMASVATLAISLQAGFMAWALLMRLLAFARGAAA